MITPKFPCSRRSLLQGIGAGVALSPFVPMLEAHAQSQAPRRLVVIWTPNGVATSAASLDRWKPVGGEWDFNVGNPKDVLAPLMEVKDSLVVLDGVTNVLGAKIASHTIPPTLLTGFKLNQTGAKNTWTSTGPSIDQVIAKSLKDMGQTTRFPSLQMGVGAQGADGEHGLARSVVVFTGPGQPIQAENKPSVIFRQLFADFVPPSPTASPPMPGVKPTVDRRKKSVIDQVRGDLARLNSRVGKDDKIKIERHLVSLAELEHSLETGSSGGGVGAQPVKACAKPADPGAPLTDLRPTMTAQMDLLTMALACDQTRIVTLQFLNSFSSMRMPFLSSAGNQSDHHGLSHGGAPSLGIIEAQNWMSGQVAALIKKLKAIPEGSGTMLDNTAVMLISEFGNGHEHDSSYLPVVLAGGSAQWKTGRVLRLNKLPHQNVLLSLAQFMRLNVSTAGDPNYCTGPVPGLV